MNIEQSHQMKKIAVVGSGVIGSTTAWHLGNLGYQVTIIDETFNQAIDYAKNLSGTTASLGILMGYVFKRSSGRSWRLRKRSMELWPQLIKKLSSNEHPLKIKTPLVQLASSLQEQQLMTNLANEREELGLEVLRKNFSLNLSRSWPENQYGGLISHQDGRIDPITLMASLMSGLTKLKIKKIKAKVERIKREGLSSNQWLVYLENKEAIKTDAVIICTANGTESLINPLGFSRPIQPILGQVLTLKSIEDKKSWKGWPAVLSCNGLNLIPYESNTFFMGATIEPGINASNLAIEKMLTMQSNCPNWIKSSSIENQWKGIRAKPTNKPAPLLESLDNGLILNTAHYRNGFLLAPACAEWVGNEIEKTILSP